MAELPWQADRYCKTIRDIVNGLPLGAEAIHLLRTGGWRQQNARQYGQLGATHDGSPGSPDRETTGLFSLIHSEKQSWRKVDAIVIINIIPFAIPATYNPIHALTLIRLAEASDDGIQYHQLPN